MKQSVQADFFLAQYGVKEGIERIKRIGYSSAVYTVADRYDAPFTTQWQERELEEHFAPVGRAFSENEISLVYTLVGNELYNDLTPATFEARKKMAIHCARACAYMGCKTLAVKPVAFYRRDSDYRRKSEALTLEAFDCIRRECDRLGLEMAVVNNKPNYATQIPYGCKVEDVLALAERYRAKVIFSPMHAAEALVDFEEFLEKTSDRLLAIRIEDAEAFGKAPCLPMMGFMDYTSLYELFGKAPSEAYGVMMSSAAYRRYRAFGEHDGLFDALDDLLFSMGSLLSAKRGEEQEG